MKRCGVRENNKQKNKRSGVKVKANKRVFKDEKGQKRKKRRKMVKLIAV